MNSTEIKKIYDFVYKELVKKDKRFEDIKQIKEGKITDFIKVFEEINKLKGN